MSNADRFLVVLIVVCTVMVALAFGIAEADSGVEAARVPYIPGKAVPVALTAQECSAGVVWIWVDLGET